MSGAVATAAAVSPVEPGALAPAVFMLLVFALGASLGSFVNVVAYRLPLKRSLSRPGSSCPSCATPVKWHDNVPVLGWFFVRGRCRACKVPLSLRYPLVELVSGLLAVAIWLMHSGPLVMPARVEQLVPTVIVPFVLHLTFVMALVALVLIDLDWFLLPDKITLPLALCGLLASLAMPKASGVTLASSALGALVGGGGPLVLGLAYGAVTGRVGLGGGDWKLLMAIGAWLGLGALPFVFFAGASSGLVAALLFRRDFALAEPPALPDDPTPAEPEAQADGDGAAATFERERAVEADAARGAEPVSFGRLHVPFGPFLGLAAMAWLFFGRELVRTFEAVLGGGSR